MIRFLNDRLGRIRDRVAGRSDAGVTLVELLVSMVVAGVLATAVTITVVQALSATRSADGRQNRAAQARVALDGATTVLRTASLYTNTNGIDVPAFDRIAPTEVVFRGNLSNFSSDLGSSAVGAPTRFRIALDTSDPADSKLVEQRWTSNGKNAAGEWTYPNSPTSTRVLAHRAEGVSGVVFTPYTEFDVATVAGAGSYTSSVALNADRSVSTAALRAKGTQALAGVRISLAITPPVGDTGGSATFSNYVDFVSKVG